MFALQAPAPIPRISVLVPVLNEVDSLIPLHGKLRAALAGESYEIIFIDDGSTDGSGRVLAALARRDAAVRVLSFVRNFGKSHALATGFQESRGAIVITLDADLQDDPAEIPRLIATLDQGYDLVSGWKHRRHDPLDKTLPSRCFNWVTARLTGIRLHDFNCGFKAYRREVVDQLQVYGELHRFIPALAYWQGFRVAEIPVVHHPRRFGVSKYGVRRFLPGSLDLLTVLFLTRFRSKPLHLFGSIGGLCLAAGLLVNAHLTWLWLDGAAIGTRPLLQLGILLMVLGIQFGSIGLLAEMITRLAFRPAQGEIRHYRVLDRSVDRPFDDGWTDTGDLPGQLPLPLFRSAGSVRESVKLPGRRPGPGDANDTMDHATRSLGYERPALLELSQTHEP